MKRLHITGCRRSGTTLLFEMIATCFKHDDHCEHEQSIFVPLEDQTVDLYFSKKPTDICHMWDIFQKDPNLHLIYVRRDPRAVVTSIHPSKADIYYASFERWLRYERAIEPFLNHSRFHIVEYEALVQEPNQVQDELQISFPFLTPSHEFANFHEHAQSSVKAQISLKGLRPISPDSLTSWKEHLPRIKFQIDKYPELPKVLVKYGYETDTEWLQLLQGVRSKSQLYGEEKRSWAKRLEASLRYKLKTRAYLSSIQ